MIKSNVSSKRFIKWANRLEKIFFPLKKIYFSLRAHRASRRQMDFTVCDQRGRDVQFLIDRRIVF